MAFFEIVEGPIDGQRPWADVITQGETKTWKDRPFLDSLCNSLAANDYTLTYALRGPTAINSKYGVDLVATAYGDGFTADWFENE